MAFVGEKKKNLLRTFCMINLFRSFEKLKVRITEKSGKVYALWF